MTFNELGLNEDLISAITEMGYESPTPIQEKAIPYLLDKQGDLIGLASTGTGKTVIAFHIAWKLFQSRWNIQRDGKRIPRIVFLADRNILANQAFNSFGAFEENALVRVKPSEVRERGHVPTNASRNFGS